MLNQEHYVPVTNMLNEEHHFFQNIPRICAGPNAGPCMSGLGRGSYVVGLPLLDTSLVYGWVKIVRIMGHDDERCKDLFQ